MASLSVDWASVEALEPVERFSVTTALLDQVAGIQERAAQVRRQAVAELHGCLNSKTAVAEALGISSGRVGQLLGDDGRRDGIKVGLLKEGLLLALEYGNLQPGDDTKVMQALGVTSKPGRRSEGDLRSVARRLATIRTFGVAWDDMSPKQKDLLRRALAHAHEVMHDRQWRPGTPAGTAEAVPGGGIADYAVETAARTGGTRSWRRT